LTGLEGSHSGRETWRNAKSGRKKKRIYNIPFLLRLDVATLVVCESRIVSAILTIEEPLLRFFCSNPPVELLAMHAARSVNPLVASSKDAVTSQR